MGLWRSKALEVLPGLRQVIADAPDVMSLWIELQIELQLAYEREPPDTQLVTAIYRYARWCKESGDEDMCTAVNLAFYEHLPTPSRVRADLARQLTRQEFEDLKPLFQYFLSAEEYEIFAGEFLTASRQRE